MNGKVGYLEILSEYIMNNGSMLLQQLYNKPQDRLTRLALADWMEEQGYVNESQILRNSHLALRSLAIGATREIGCDIDKYRVILKKLYHKHYHIVPKKYWYKMYVGECPVCGEDKSYRERVYGEKPKRWEDRYVQLSSLDTYDGCMR